MLIKIIGIGILTVVSTMLIKELKPELSFLVSMAGSLVIILIVLSSFNTVIHLFDIIVKKTNINSELFSLILKIIGIGYLAEFAANICLDAGNKSVADKIILGGKIVILVKCFPIINSLIDIIIGFMP